MERGDESQSWEAGKERLSPPGDGTPNAQSWCLWTTEEPPSLGIFCASSYLSTSQIHCMHLGSGVSEGLSGEVRQTKKLRGNPVGGLLEWGLSGTVFTCVPPPCAYPPPGTTPTQPQIQVCHFLQEAFPDLHIWIPRAASPVVSCCQLWLCFQCPASTCILVGVWGSFRVEAMRSAPPDLTQHQAHSTCPILCFDDVSREVARCLDRMGAQDSWRYKSQCNQPTAPASRQPGLFTQGQKTQQMPPRKLTGSFNWKANVAQAHLDYCYLEQVLLLFLSLPFSLSLHPCFLHLWIPLLYGNRSVTALGRRREGCHRRSPSGRAEQVTLPWLLQQFPRISTT